MNNVYTVSDRTELLSLIKSNNYKLENYTFEIDFVLTEECPKLKIESCIFKKSFRLNGAKFKGEVRINKSNFLSELRIENALFENDISLIACSIFKNVIIKKSTINNYFSFSAFCDKKETEDKKETDDKIIIHFWKLVVDKDTTLSILSRKDNDIHNIKSLGISNCVFKRNVSLRHNLKVKNPYLVIINSIIESCFHFEGNYGYVKFERFFINGTLSVKNLEFDEYSKNTVNLIKQHLLRVNNRLEAWHYHYLEMKVLLEGYFYSWPLSNKKKFKRLIKKLNNNKINKWLFLSELFKKMPFRKADFYILFFSLISNKHGLSWTRGVLFTIVCSCLFFMLFNSTLEDPIFQLGWDGFTSYWKSIKTSFPFFVKFIYPAHSFDFMSSNNPNHWSALYDLLGRIFIGFGYYQTIQAFRKTGKL